MLRRSALLFVATTLAAAAPAHAESRAWAVAKRVLPAGLQIVGGISFERFRGTPLFQQQWQAAIGRHGTFDKMRERCGLDAPSQVDSVAVGLDGDRNGAIVIALKTGERQLDACYAKLARAAGESGAIERVGDVAHYAPVAKGDGELYVRWLARDVVAVATDPGDRDLLARMTAGGLARDRALIEQLAAVRLDAPMWGVVHQTLGLSVVPATMSMAYGMLDVKADRARAEVHFVVDSAEVAADSADALDRQVSLARTTGVVPDWAEPLVDSLAFKAQGRELIVTGAASEADLAAAASHVH
ncbi:MAG TPA: hypothetical protein VLX92_06330 [Kofleriaceae bacterium]|nr:hypothetical protein [Kofleriaceae bacterium]